MHTASYITFLAMLTILIIMHPDCFHETKDDTKNTTYTCYNYGETDIVRIISANYFNLRKSKKGIFKKSQAIFNSNQVYRILASFCILYAITNILNLLLVLKIEVSQLAT